MAKLKIAVLGATGIGKFHVREFKNAGTEVVAILGRNADSATKTAEGLLAAYGVRPNAYCELDRLIETESVDAVSVCTPDQMHYAQVKKCLESGLHVLCEKPLAANSYANNYREARELIELSEKQNKILAVNTQWPSVLDVIKNRVHPSTLHSFSTHMEPRSFGADMLAEQLSHTNSMVVKLIPGGHPEEIRIVRHSEEDIDVYFRYGNDLLLCDIHNKFTHRTEGQRKVIFTFDGTEFRREVDENRQQSLVTDNEIFGIEDPFKVSVGMFVGAVEGKNMPLVSKKEIIENVALQDELIAEYLKLY